MSNDARMMGMTKDYTIDKVVHQSVKGDGQFSKLANPSKAENQFASHGKEAADRERLPS